MQWGRKEAGYSQPREPWEEHHTASCLEDGEHKTDFVIVVLADSVDCGLSGCCHAGLMHMKNPSSPSRCAGLLHASERPCSQ